jgi:phytanoyl-CoA hydroxylase
MLISGSEIKKFNLDDKKEIQEYYQNYGYVVISSAIDVKKIEAFLDAYKLIKNNPLFVYYSQSIHTCIRPELNEYGYIQESMKDASRLAFFRKFSKRFQACIYDDGVSQALTTLSGEKEHVSWQNMFFDQSTGTVEHQDSWYLDTEIPGNLIGVWYALENIHKDCGPFFVIPGSHKVGLLDRKKISDHNDFVDAVFDITSRLEESKKPMNLDRGDILLWHPYLIHGAFSCQDKSMSRKSFTSHFYPKSLNAKDTEKDKLISVYNHQKPRKTNNLNIYSAYGFSDYLYNMIVYILYLKDNFSSMKRSWSMRREDYAR